MKKVKRFFRILIISIIAFIPAGMGGYAPDYPPEKDKVVDVK